MYLFFLIALLCLLNTLLPDFIRNYLKVSRFWKKDIKSRVQQLQSELDVAKEALEAVNNNAHNMGEYEHRIRISRAQNKIDDIIFRLFVVREGQNLKLITIDTVSYYVSKVLFSLVVVIVCARNRSSAVVIFDDHYSLAPMGGLLSFPTGIYNAISVPVWAFSCNFTFSLLYGIIKK